LSKNNILNRLSGVQKLLEVGIITSTFIAIFIGISLFTFSPVDPSWSQQQWVAEIHNAGGKVGAWIADILFYGFGLLAYFIPVVIVAFAWIFLWKPKFSLEIDFLNLGLRIIGFIFTVFSTSALASLNFDDYHYYPSGGLIGDIIAQSMLGFFSLLAVNLILLTLLISGTTLLLGFSWLSLIDSIGAFVINVFTWVFALPGRFLCWKEKRNTEKQLQLEHSEEDQEQNLSKNSRSIVNNHPVVTTENLPEESITMQFHDADIDDQYLDAPFNIDITADEENDLQEFTFESPQLEEMPPFVTEPAKVKQQAAAKPSSQVNNDFK